ncbi:hypothetical protein HAX54_044843, partial [Datura stramonium]|nr:hypothetical protein [Datura stramonium]
SASQGKMFERIRTRYRTPPHWVRGTEPSLCDGLHATLRSTRPKPLPFNPKFCILPSFLPNTPRQNPHSPFPLERATLEHHQILFSSSQLRVT